MIKEKCINYITQILAKTINTAPDSERYTILKYGVELLYINLYKTLLLVIIAVCLGIIKQVAIFACAYCALRTFAFGIHLNNGAACMMWGLINFIASAFLSKVLYIPVLAVTVISLLALFALLFYAPSGTVKRPIGDKERYRLKLLAVAVLVMLYFIMVIDSGYIRTLIFFAVVCETINILPITYKIFHLERRG